MKAIITAMESPAHSHTSPAVKVRIDVEPKSVLQTSPVRFDEVEKIFIRRYPIARDATEIIATAASP